jgi:carbamate kinase
MSSRNRQYLVTHSDGPLVTDFMNKIMSISENIEDEKARLVYVKVELLCPNSESKYVKSFKDIITHKMQGLKMEQEIFCALLRSDVNASKDAFDTWKEFVQSILDTHMFDKSYEAYIVSDAAHIIYGSDAITMHISHVFKQRFNYIDKYISIAQRVMSLKD